MRIAVVKHIHSGDYAEYLSSLIDEQARQKDYQVKTWSSSVPASQQFISENAVVYIIIESNTQPAIKWWYRIKLPSILKKLKARLVIDLNGIAAYAIKIPRVVAFSQEIFAANKKLVKGRNKLAAKQMEQSIAGAKNVVIYSKEKAGEINKNAANGDKFHVIPFAAPVAFRTFEWHEKIMIKAQQADNREYFISVLEDEAEDSFITLLRAFSKFKKWQQSSMQLLLLPKYESFSGNIRQKLETYKYRDDVRLLEDLEEIQIAPILASAYALVHVSLFQPDLVVLAAALQCSLPVITQEHPDVKEYAGKAALYAGDKSFETLGDALIQLYKDENLHAQLQEAAKEKAVLLNRDEYEIKLWTLLETAAHS